MTWRRLRNEVRCRLTYSLSLLGVNRVAEGPTFVSVEPANYCMLRCPQCPVGMAGGQPRERRQMDMRVYRAAIDNIAQTAHTVIFYFQGEPLLHKELPEMIAYAHAKRLFTMVSTNGLLLTDELSRSLLKAGLDRIIVSVDGLTEESYGVYRVGGRLELALAGLRALRVAKDALHAPTEIVLQCLRLRSNEREWNRFQEEYKQLGADRLEMKTAQFYNFEQGNELMPSNSRYSRYKRAADGQYYRKKAYHNHCYRLWSGCVITTQGDVLPCCFDKEHEHVFGNIMEIPFPWLWHTVEADAFREEVLHHRKDIAICRNCTE